MNKRVEILLVTTSTGKNWTIPKGNVKKKLGPLQSAVEEGWEEAGISGVIQQPHIGKFQLRKRGKLYAVKVFPCRVEKAVKNFPEEKIRRRKWAPAKEAAELVKHAGLKKLLSGVEETILSMNAV